MEADRRRTSGARPDRPEMPWDDLSFLPPKPEGIEWAYVDRERRLVRCGFDELEAQARRDDGSLVVAAPGFDHLVPPQVVPELESAIVARDKALRKSRHNRALVVTVAGGAFALLPLLQKQPPEPLILILVLAFGVIPLIQDAAGAVRRRLRGQRTIPFDERADRARFGAWIGSRSRPATFACVGVLVAIYVAQMTFGLELSVGAAALVKPAVREGEWWRLLTGPLLHGGIAHIYFNGFAFLNVGSVLEALYGRAMLLLTFLVSALAGSLASLALMPAATSVGASGGIMGLVGFLLVVGLRHRRCFPADFGKSIVRAVLFIAAIGLVAWHWIDNAAHFGGLAAGCAVALPLTGDASRIGRVQPGPLVRAAGHASGAMLTAGAAWTLYRLVTMG